MEGRSHRRMQEAVDRASALTQGLRLRALRRLGLLGFLGFPRRFPRS